MNTYKAQEALEKLIQNLSELEQHGKITAAGQGRFVPSDAHLHLILNTLCVGKGAILLFNPVELSLSVEVSSMPKADIPAITLTPPQVSALLETPCFDLAAPPPALQSLLEGARPQLNRLDAQVWATLKIEDRLLGVLSLSDTANLGGNSKLSGTLLQMVVDRLSTFLGYAQFLDEMRRAKLRLFLLSDTTAQIAKLLDTERLAGAIVNHSVSLLDANTGGLLFINPFTQRLEMKAVFDMEPQTASILRRVSLPLRASQTLPPGFDVLREVVVTGHTLTCNDAVASAIFGAENFMAAPIFGREILGALMVCGKEGRNRTRLHFTPEDEILLEAFATQAGIAIENATLYQEACEKRRLQAEMEEAAKVQQNLLPRESPDLPGYDIAGLSVARSDGVGGDCFDYIPCPDGSWGFAIVDVSGKGMQAALLMATLRAGLRSEVARGMDLPEMAVTLNSLIYESSIPDRYATLFYAKLEPEEMRLTSINAGHVFPLIVRYDGRVERLTKGGLVLGMYPYDLLLKIAQYEQEVTHIASGDVVLFFTDGVTDTVNTADELFEEERLQTIMQQLRHKTAGEICDELYRAVLQFKGDAQLFDDLTLMALKKT